MAAKAKVVLHMTRTNRRGDVEAIHPSGVTYAYVGPLRHESRTESYMPLKLRHRRRNRSSPM